MINEQIRDKEVRLIAEDGEQLGIVDGKEAQRMADEKSLDLVKISPGAKPPVCKIMDYSKYRFDQQKREKEARKKQKTVTIKELRLSPNTDTHDVNVKIKKANEFLKDGDKVKVSIRFRGRELGHTQVAYKILGDFAEAVSELGTIEKPPKMEGRSMAMFLTPKADNKSDKNKAQKPKEEQVNA
ncbi:MAG: translation initiation factor IF-3 [Defluviitaleaceae bacterium]|nr:translation initiation factor IF-3 [Defluviitaleaceae bacterium]